MAYAWLVDVLACRCGQWDGRGVGRGWWVDVDGGACDCVQTQMVVNGKEIRRTYWMCVWTMDTDESKQEKNKEKITVGCGWWTRLHVDTLHVHGLRTRMRVKKKERKKNLPGVDGGCDCMWTQIRCVQMQLVVVF